MGDVTNISWANATFNPWIGCTKVSPACDHCYAAAWDKRFGGDHWGPGAPRRRTTAANWRKPFRWNAEAKSSGKPCRVFCASLADVFDNEVDPLWRTDLFNLIRATRSLTWMLLTKRIGNAAKMLPSDWGDGWPHVWLGSTVPDQAEADRDIPKLLATPAAVRFISYEPALENVDFTELPPPNDPKYQSKHWIYRCNSLNGLIEVRPAGPNIWWQTTYQNINLSPPRLNWVICGGESGPGARPMHPDWARSVRNQCAGADVAFFFKQWGGPRAGGEALLDGVEHKAWPA